jgi:uncharacterized protein (TIGR03118 family)
MNKRSYGLGVLGTVLVVASCMDLSGMPQPPAYYVRSDLTSDLASTPAGHVDSNLVNPWGLAYGPQTYFWTANNGSGTSTVYDGNGSPMPAPPLVVTVPPTPGGNKGSPTGVVFNGSSDFAGDRFIFASLDGTISGWAAGTSATVRWNNSASGASYTGLAIGGVGTANYLYAANFAGHTVDVLNASYIPVSLSASAFTDPTLPAGFSPFGIQALGGVVYLAYAQNAVYHNAGNAAGQGYVSVFNMDGTFVQRLVSQDTLNAPWGMARGRAGLLGFSDALLVGNFGDGRINSYDPLTGRPLGQLLDAAGAPIAIDGLWGLAFGNGAKAGSASELYFTAGTQGSTHGLFGALSAAEAVDTGEATSGY